MQPELLVSRFQFFKKFLFERSSKGKQNQLLSIMCSCFDVILNLSAEMVACSWIPPSVELELGIN